MSMPRVNLNKKQIEIRDFSHWVRGMLADKKLRQQDLADFLNLPRPSITMRLSGEWEWKLSEIVDCCEFFGETYTVGKRI